MPVRAGEHSGWLGTGSLGSVAPCILMMKVISRNFFFFWGGFHKLEPKRRLEEDFSFRRHKEEEWGRITPEQGIRQLK